MEPNEPNLKVVSNLIEDINNSAPEVKSIEQLIRESLIPQGVKIPEPDTVFQINEVPIFTKKSIGTLIGRAKSGKTTVTAWIVAESIKQKISTLWIDTEQGLYYGSRTQFWILSMAGQPKSDYLNFYDLKIFPPNERVQMIEMIIKEFKPDLVVIDGIRDLVFDINNPEEATKRTGDLMRWADIYDCHVLNILHQNKGNEHARGHLGTEMINKSETVMRVEQDEGGLIVCNPEYTRSKAFELFAFDRDDKGMPFIVSGYSGNVDTNTSSGKRKNSIDPTDIGFNSVHEEVVDSCFRDSEFLKYSDVLSKIRHYFAINGVVFGDSKAREFLTHYEHIKLIWKPDYAKGNAKYQKNPLFDPLVLTVAGSKRMTTDMTDESPF